MKSLVNNRYIYRITSVLKVETDIITSITLSSIGWAVILVICVLIPSKLMLLFLSVLNVIMWSHTDWYFPVSESVCWYWQYHPVRSKESNNIHRLMHALFHIRTVIIQRDRYRPEGYSPRVDISWGMITVLKWKKACINLLIT
jgi:hypothetical protein